MITSLSPGRVSVCATGVRVELDEAQQGLDASVGRTARDALQLLRFNPGYTCIPVARVVEQALRECVDISGAVEASVIIESYRLDAGPDVVRVRRKAHGMADWITTKTVDVTVDLHIIEG